MGDERVDTADGDDAVTVVLAEPARQRLLSIAADVLGRLTPEETPPALRPVARFTPAKRLRLGAPMLSAALDADEAFRNRVRDVVVEASPQLAAAVGSGESTAASDPLDTEVIAYLVRPDGWEQIIAVATEQWAAERDRTGEAASQAEVDRLRAELTELRAQLRADAARAKQSLAAAVDDVRAELADARRQLRLRTSQLQAAERAAQQAKDGEAEALRRAEAAEAGREAEARRARGRTAELERAVEAARRGARTEREVDDARLWLLIDTLTEAAAGLRRELSLPAPTLRPADAVPTADAPTPQLRGADDPAALDRLLALPNTHLIVDGYNVTKSGYGELALADQRARLIGSLAGLVGRSRVEVTVAFDGGQRPPAAPPTPRGVRVLFSDPDEIADDLIRRLVAAEPAGRPVVVVTSDHEVQRDVRRTGAWTAPSSVLLARLAQV